MHPDDPGYHLRPEHIESTYVLHAVTGNPQLLETAANIQQTLQQQNRVDCGYASIQSVNTGEGG